MSDSLQNKLQKLIRKLVRAIQKEVAVVLATVGNDADYKTSIGEPLWVSAFVDVRWFGDAEGWLAKFRVVLPNGNLHGVHTTRDMDNLFREIWSVRKEDVSADWYGLKVTVTSNAKMAAEYNIDPRCTCDQEYLRS